MLKTTQLAYRTYITKNLRLIDPDTRPENFESEAQKKYGNILNGGALEGNKKPGDDEAKIKMHVKTVAKSVPTILHAEQIFKQEPGDQSDERQVESISNEAFYATTIDIIHFYLDMLGASTVPGDAYEIFTKVTKKYEERFFRDMRDLNVLDPDVITRVTEYGDEIANFVEKIVANNFGYVTSDGSIYFDIKAFEKAGNHYARLEPWNRNNQPLQRDGEGSLAHAIEKRSPHDFALWKSSRPGEPSWNSQWGQGRPGWHIECSAMASSQFGRHMDIHSGGIDLAFPHHDNEIAQSEAYWSEDQQQWVNYFLHMGHLSIQGSKMSKSLKNFTTIRNALDQGDWTSRSLRIVFLLGGWRDGVEITPELIRTASAWEDKLSNFFVKVKGLSVQGRASEEASTSQSLDQALKTAQDKVYERFCDSFDTPGVMAIISDLVSSFNNLYPTVNPEEAKNIALWVTQIVTILGLNGAESPNVSEIGWEGTTIPEAAKSFLYPLSQLRDSLREAARSQSEVTSEKLKSMVDSLEVGEGDVSDAARPFFEVLSNFRQQISPTNASDPAKPSKEILSICDQLRDVHLFNLGIYLEDRDNKPALVRPLTKDIMQMREEQERKALQKQREKEKQENLERERLEKGRISHFEMFRTEDFSDWDDDGLPTKDAAGEPINKSRSKKLRKDWERQKKLHEAWLASQSQ